MRYLSLFSGIEAASVAWHPLGWTPVAFAEIESFPSAVLAERFPGVPNFGDVSNFKEWNKDGTVDLIVGGSPCQSFSVAGLRKGLDDPRGNLALTYLAIVDKYRPEWIVWENVPGVLSSNRGRDFGSFLGALDEIGYGYAWRVLDAQYVRTPDYPRAVPQRRRRVFVVGNLRDAGRAAAVLFDSESLSGNPPPRREKREAIATDAEGGAQSDGESVTYQNVVGALCAEDAKMTQQQMANQDKYLVVSNREVSDTVTSKWNKGSGGPAGSETGNMVVAQDIAGTLDASYHKGCGERGGIEREVVAYEYQSLRNAMQVRRLTPVECERLQGFPDDWTRIPWRKKEAQDCPDGPRYKAIGNSMAVNVMQWIGMRIAMVEEITDETC